MSKKDWVWMPHAGHFILADSCRFRMATYLGNGYLVSTVGELWPDRDVRRIHASVHDPAWHAEHDQLRGDPYDSAYMSNFGFDTVGFGRKYETMVFEAKPNDGQGYACCPFVMANPSELACEGYNDAEAAREGHMALCETWARKRS